MKKYALLAAAVLLSLLSSASSAEVRYTITELPSPPGATSVQATGMNDQGQVSGFANYGSGVVRPLTWDHGIPQLIEGDEAWQSGYAGGINAHGHAVLNGQDRQGRKNLFLATRSTLRPLRPIAPASSAAVLGLNDLDHAVGYSLDGTGRTHAVLWRGRAALSLGVKGDDGTTANDIDNDDRIVGVRVIDGVARPFRWHHGLLSWLDRIEPGSTANVLASNNRGLAVGGADTPDGPRAVLWTDTRATVLGTLPGHLRSSARDINDLAQIVGSSSENEASAAVLWQDGHPRDLNELIDYASSWRLSDALGINNNGQVVGSGILEGRPGIFLLTPIPEPTNALAMALLTIRTLCRRPHR